MSIDIDPADSVEQANRENQYYLYELILLSRYLRARPKKEAYLYFPKKDDQIIENPKKPEKALRMIFHNVIFTEYEDAKLKEFYERVEFLNQKYPNKKIVIPSWWKESETRRFLQATSFTIDKSIEYIRQQLEWKSAFFPFTITSNIIKILNSGFMYIHGRDNHFRPIFIIKANTFFDLRKIYSYEEMFMSIVYFLEYVIKNILIVGQVENWIMITDITGVSLVFMPRDLKRIIDSLGSCYRCKLFRNYIIGMNSALRLIVKLFMSFLDQATVNKIKFLDSNNIHSELSTFINDDNLEKKFGGNAPNIIPGDNNVFPPVMPSDNFSKEGDNLLISEEEYKSKCNGKDKPTVICEEFIEKWEREKIEKEEEEERIKISMMNNNNKPKIDLKRRKSNKENERNNTLVVQKEQYDSKYIIICRKKAKGRKKVSSLLGIKSLNYNTPNIHISKNEGERENDSAKTGIAIQKTNI